MTENENDKPAFEPMKAIGAFLALFGLAVIGAMFIEMPAADKVINGICGLVIVTIGAALFYLGVRRTK